MHQALHGKLLCLEKVESWKNYKIKTLEFVASEQRCFCWFTESSHAPSGIYLRSQ